jgi:hypothetical protein
LAVFTKLETLVLGKTSIMRGIQSFVMTIQLYEVGSTDLDEVAEALRDAVEGINFYIGNSTTLHARKPLIKEANKKVVEEFSKAQRFVSFGLSKVAARLVYGNDDKDSKSNKLAKFKVFELGIAENYIPLLSENCKKEIEGSFKITNDKDMRALCMKSESEVELSDT